MEPKAGQHWNRVIFVDFCSVISNTYLLYSTMIVFCVYFAFELQPRPKNMKIQQTPTDICFLSQRTHPRAPSPEVLLRAGNKDNYSENFPKQIQYQQNNENFAEQTSKGCSSLKRNFFTHPVQNANINKSKKLSYHLNKQYSTKKTNSKRGGKSNGTGPLIFPHAPWQFFLIFYWKPSNDTNNYYKKKN